MRNTGLDEAQAGIKTARRNVNNLRYADYTPFMAESEEIKSLLMKVKEKSDKAGLQVNIQKTKIMASGPITSWQTDGETKTLFWGGSKVTPDGDCSHEIKRHLLLGRKVMTNLDSIFEQRHFTFHFHALEEEMATHSSILAWRIPRTGEPGRLPSMGLHRVRYD